MVYKDFDKKGWGSNGKFIKGSNENNQKHVGAIC